MEVDPWCNVHNQLPEDGQWVVGYRGTEEDMLSSTRTPFILTQAWLLHNQQLREQEGITHWLPIPEPPHVEGDVLHET